MPNHEKRVATQLAGRFVEAYVPLYDETRQWSDRRMRVHLPLFPNYVFVRLGQTSRARVLELAGVVSFVSFGGHTAAISAAEIERLRASLQKHNARPYPYLVTGKRVRFRGGAFDGLEGVVQCRRNQTRVIVTLDSIQRSISIEADAADLRCIA